MKRRQDTAGNLCVSANTMWLHKKSTKMTFVIFFCKKNLILSKTTGVNDNSKQKKKFKNQLTQMSTKIIKTNTIAIKRAQKQMQLNWKNVVLTKKS